VKNNFRISIRFIAKIQYFQIELKQRITKVKIHEIRVIRKICGELSVVKKIREIRVIRGEKNS